MFVAVLTMAVPASRAEPPATADSTAFYLYAMELYEARNYRTAADYLTKAIERAKKPADKVDSYHQRGLCRYNLKEYQAWLADENAAIAIDPRTRPQLYWGRGNARSWLKDYEGQVADFETALQLAMERNVSDKADYQTRLREAQEALTYNVEARDHPEAHDYFKSGRAKQDKDTYRGLTGAIEDFTKAIALDPKWAPSFHERAQCKRRLEERRGGQKTRPPRFG